MASTNSERVELAKLCCSRNWSKAIRILDSLLSRSSTIQDLWFHSFSSSLFVLSIFSSQILFTVLISFLFSWVIFDEVDSSYMCCVFSLVFDVCKISNRAFCYSQLELHKHVIKDCDRALELDPSLLQAYILKGKLWFMFFW